MKIQARQPHQEVTGGYRIVSQTLPTPPNISPHKPLRVLWSIFSAYHSPNPFSMSLI